jgi:dynein heavy chain
VDRRARFSDVWVYDATADGGKGSWSLADTGPGPAPEPRAHFSATRVDDRIIVFGGYGGGGQVFGDTWVLHVLGPGGAHGFRWENITDQLQGDAPPARFDHAAFVFPVTPNSVSFDKLMIMGGRDVGVVLGDAHVLDLATFTWERAGVPDGSSSGAAAGAPAPVGEVCCAVVEDVESVPHHKVRGESPWGRAGSMRERGASLGGGFMATSGLRGRVCGSHVQETRPFDACKHAKQVAPLDAHAAWSSVAAR